MEITPVLSTITREVAGAVNCCPHFEKDVLSYHENDEECLLVEYDEDTGEEPILQSKYVAVVLRSNPVAIKWQLVLARNGGIYIFYPHSATFETTDKALECKLGEKGMQELGQELQTRLAELVKSGDLLPPDISEVTDGENDPTTRFLRAMLRDNVHNVKRSCLYQQPGKLQALVGRVPSDEELLAKYRESHEGDAIAVPVPFWNHHCRLIAKAEAH